MKLTSLILHAFTLLGFGFSQDIPYNPSYGWQFSINDYQRKEFEFTTEIIYKGQKIPFSVSCSQGLFNISNTEINLLEKNYKLKRERGGISIGNTRIYCSNKHTSLKSSNLWKMLGYTGNIKLMRANSESLKTPLFSSNLNVMVLPILENFSAVLKSQKGRIYLSEVDQNLKVCFEQRNNYACLRRGEGVNYNKDLPFTISITNKDYKVTVFYQLDFRGNKIVAWGDDNNSK